MKTKPMTMRVVSGRGILVVAAVAVFMLHPPPACGGALTWHFSQITEVTGTAFVAPPAINASGQVTFWQISDVNQWDSPQAIYKGVVGSLDTVVDTTGPSFVALGVYPTINDLGDVGFSAHKSFGKSSIIRYTAATQGLTSIAEGDENDSNTPFSFVSGSSINNSGTVAFRGRFTDTDQRFIAVGTGGPPSYVDGVSPPWRFDDPMIQRAGSTLEVAWGARSGSDPVILSRIQKGGSFNHTTIAEGSLVSPQFLEVGTTLSISNAGDVSFIAQLAGGGAGVYYGNGGAPTLVADTNGEFMSFYPGTTISNAGVAFSASLDFSGSGVFTGPNVLTDKVLAMGDTIAGLPSTVETVYLSTHAMNDSGQIALSVRFADGTHRILRADPYILQQIPEGLLAVSVIKSALFSSMSQTVETPGGEEDLSFDYCFPTTTGQLVVTLGGVELARIDAPDELADGFTVFQIPVDVNRLFPDHPDELLLEFSLLGASDTSGLYLDNIVFGALDNGGFGTGDLTGWRSTFTEGDGVGVAVDPFYIPIPEPATLGMLALGGLSLLRRRKS